MVSKPTEETPTLPSYRSTSPEALADSPTSKYSRSTWDTRKKIFGLGRKRDSVGPPLPINISAPLNVNPQFAHLVQRPDSAMHPSRTTEGETVRYKY